MSNNKKDFTKGLIIGVVGTSVLNAVGAVIGNLIAAKKAQRALEALSELDDDCKTCGCDTCNCAESEE